MTTEDDFQAALDACPEDFQTRLVFADWLQDRNDPRAIGYRALGMCRVWPHRAEDKDWKSWCYHNGKGTTGPNWEPMAICHRIPSQRWLDLIQDEEYRFFKRDRPPTRNTVLSSCFPKKRRDLEDCAALAFLKLEPLEQQAMLSGDAQ